MINLFNELKALAQYFIFWLLICFIDRLLFITAFSKKFEQSNYSEILSIYKHGLMLDFSLASYLCILPFLVYTILSFSKRVRFSRKFLDFYTIFGLVIFFLTSFTNINIYREWGNKISKRAIDNFIASPVGAFSSARSTPIFVPLVGAIVSIVICYLLYRYMFKRVSFYRLDNNWKKIGMSLGLLVVLFTFIRGGYGRAPLNTSKAYYSENSFYNHAAVNTQWAFLRDYFSSNTLQSNPYEYYSTTEQIDKQLAPVYSTDISNTQSILTTDKPNVVVIVLESFVGQLVESLGGEPGIAPHLEKLIKGGVFFDNIYSASDRSDKGMIGIFSGFPAQGKESIIKYISKHENLPAIGQEFSKAGYTGSFYHGGQSEFYNFKSYMLMHGVSKIVDNSSFGVTVSRASWGVYDHLIFDRMLKDLDSEQQPFFSSMFSINNHEPFDIPGNYKFGKESVVDKFKSSAYYTDESLYNFITQAKTKSWYKNTLFVVVADHGHRLPTDKYDISHPERFHIPLLFFGDVIKPEYRGTKIHKIGNQTDIATTLLTQVGLSTKYYHWSRDLLNPATPDVAFYNSKDAFGIISPKQTVSYDNVGQIINYTSNKSYPKSQTDSLLSISKAYYQKVYNEFLAY